MRMLLSLVWLAGSPSPIHPGLRSVDVWACHFACRPIPKENLSLLGVAASSSLPTLLRSRSMGAWGVPSLQTFLSPMRMLLSLVWLAGSPPPIHPGLRSVDVWACHFACRPMRRVCGGAIYTCCPIHNEDLSILGVVGWLLAAHASGADACGWVGVPLWQAVLSTMRTLIVGSSQSQSLMHPRLSSLWV